MEPNQLNIDTICAISTPPGIGGIAVIRVSGPRAIEIVDTLWKGKPLAKADSHTAHLGTILDSRSEMLDQAVATVFRAPHSYTGDDVVELSVHGSRWIQRELIATLCQAGCRLAEPGEYTRRAFAAGHLDLAEAEAVADMIASNSRAAHRAAASQMRGHYSARLAEMRRQLIELASLLELELDFSEEDVEFASRQRLVEIAGELLHSLTTLRDTFATGAAIKEGIPVAIVGPTNAGKSSLLNAISGDDRAIVSDIHGTTRDVIDDLIEIGDYQFRFHDTAGLRNTNDTIERIGIQRSIDILTRARIIIYMIDATDPLPALETLTSTQIPPTATLIVALNKIDLLTAAHPQNAPTATASSHPREQQSETVTRLIEQIKTVNPQAIVIPMSTKTAQGLTELKETLTNQIDGTCETSDLIVTNARHAQALAAAAASTERTLAGLRDNLSGDLIAQDIRETIHHLGTITGAITTDTLLTTIFTRFCIGK